MRYFTGDESGLIKSIVILPPPPPEPKKKRSRQEDKVEKEDKKKKEEEVKHIINTFGKVDKQACVQKLQWATINNDKVIVIARQNGKIECMNPDTGDIIISFTDEEIEKAQTDKPNTNRVKFIGLEATEKHLITCNSNGTLTMTEWDKDQLSIIHKFDYNNNNDKQLEIMRIHPIHQHILAIGGKEIDLKVFDLNKLIDSSSSSSKENEVKEENEKKDSKKNKGQNPHQKQKNNVPGLLYEAKNVKNDFLNLQQPVWIHDLQFMNEDGSQIALSTHHHQIRLYDFKKARRPVINTEIGKKPLTTLSIGQDFDHVVFTDTMNDVGFFNIKTEKLAGQLKGFSGAAKATQISPMPNLKSEKNQEENPIIVSVSLDRFLRIHELKTRLKVMEHKIYLKQRLTSLLIDSDYIVDTIQKQQQEEDDELWNNLDTIKDDKNKNKKKKQRLE